MGQLKLELKFMERANLHLVNGGCENVFRLGIRLVWAGLLPLTGQPNAASLPERNKNNEDSRKDNRPTQE